MEAPPAAPPAPAAPPEPAAGPAAIVELGRAPVPAVTYTPPAPGPASGIAEAARVHTNVHVKEQVAGEAHAGEATWSLAEGSGLNFNSHIDTLVGSGPGTSIVLEEGAKLSINQHVGTLTAGADGGTIVVGEGASLHLNLHADAATTGLHLVVPDGVKMHLDVHARSEAPPPALAAPPPPAPPANEPAKAEAAAPAAESPPPPPPAKQARRAEEKDDLGDVRDLRWRLLRDVVETFRRHQLEWTERNDDERERGAKKALGHVHKKS